MRVNKSAFAASILTLCFLAPTTLLAQDDPPTRIARISYLQGSVGFQPAGTEDWIDAPRNRPLTTGDEIWTESGSRAVLHSGSASFNLSENTGFTFLNLSENTIQVQLSSGTLRLRVKWLDPNEIFEVDTPNLAFTVFQPGIYKISVNNSGDTTIVEDRRGEGEVDGGGAAYSIHQGDVGTFYGINQLNVDMQYVDNNVDDFERWCEQRDHHEDVSISARYVSNYAVGYDDLDDNGGWRPVPEYGMVWFPHTSVVDWAPYHYGHWSYVAPWGYTWVDDAAWGFAPFHYGRWVNYGGSWGWVPCPPRPQNYTVEYVPPVYAPALVAWIGGRHFGIGISAGVGVGWFPLGPREVYVPSYPVSRTYVNNINVSNTTVNTTVVNNYYTNIIVNKTVNITNVTYVNQRVAGAVVATSPQAFTSGQSVAKNAVRFDPREIATAPVVALTPPAVPQREAVLGGRPAANVKPPAAIQARAVVVKTAPPPPPPSFAKRQEAIQSNGGRPLSMTQARQIAPSRAQLATGPQIKVAPPAKPIEPRTVEATKKVQPLPAENTGNRLPAPQQPNKPSALPLPAVSAKANANHPPTAFPENDQLEKQHQQQVSNLQKQEDQQRQKLEQQQQQQAQQLRKQQAEAAQSERQKRPQELQQQQPEGAKQQQLQQQQAQRKEADAAKLQQLQLQHQQQIEALEQRHKQEQEALAQKQEAEHRAQQQLMQQQKAKPPPAKPNDKKETKQ